MTKNRLAHIVVIVVAVIILSPSIYLRRGRRGVGMCPYVFIWGGFGFRFTFPSLPWFYGFVGTFDALLDASRALRALFVTFLFLFSGARC